MNWSKQYKKMYVCPYLKICLCIVRCSPICGWCRSKMNFRKTCSMVQIQHIQYNFKNV
uniref:Uncharacterized protein n=1 Tax=Anguilla anguilla TaxID=7936 RepID=A0A0E9PX63_ANGAN